MKTDYQGPDFSSTRRRHNRKPKTARASSKKRKASVYPGLNEFLSQYPVATVNEYGEKVIYGRRVC